MPQIMVEIEQVGVSGWWCRVAGGNRGAELRAPDHREIFRQAFEHVDAEVARAQKSKPAALTPAPQPEAIPHPPRDPLKVKRRRWSHPSQ